MPDSQTVSRQRLFQIQHVNQGLCGACSEPLFFAGKCVAHYKEQLEKIRRRVGVRRASEGALGYLLLAQLEGKPLGLNALSQMIREHRAENLMKLKDFSEAVGISASDINDYEAGLPRLRADHALRLANYFEVPESEIEAAAKRVLPLHQEAATAP